jgi:hypothetical protein
VESKQNERVAKDRANRVQWFFEMPRYLSAQRLGQIDLITLKESPGTTLGLKFERKSLMDWKYTV